MAGRFDVLRSSDMSKALPLPRADLPATDALLSLRARAAARAAPLRGRAPALAIDSRRDASAA